MEGTSPADLPPSGLALELSELVHKLDTVSSRYYELGIQLKVPTDTLNAIENSTTSTGRRLIDVLEHWLRHDKKETHTWDVIFKALDRIGYNALAQEIKTGNQFGPKKCAVAKLPPCAPTATREDQLSAYKHMYYRRLTTLYGRLMTIFMEYLEDLGPKKVKCYFQNTFHLDCEDYSSSEKIFERMSSLMSPYNISLIQELVDTFPNEYMSDNVKTYLEWKKLFLDSTPMGEFEYSFEQRSAPPDVCEVKFKVNRSLVCDRENKMKLMDKLAQCAFGQFYINLSEIEHLQYADTFCWRIPKLVAVESIARVQKHLLDLNKQGVEEVTFGHFQLMPCHCQAFSTTSPPIRSLSLTDQSIGKEQLQLQNHSLETRIQTLEREKEGYLADIANFQSQIEELEKEIQDLKKAQQKRNADEDTEDDSTCEQKCAKQKERADKIEKLFKGMLCIATQVMDIEENQTKSREVHPLVKDEKNTPSLEGHLSTFTIKFFNVYERFLNPVMVKRIRGWQQDTTLEDSLDTLLTGILQPHIASDDFLSPVFIKGRVTASTATVKLRGMKEKELFENMDHSMAELAEKLTEKEAFKTIAVADKPQYNESPQRQLEGKHASDKSEGYKIILSSSHQLEDVMAAQAQEGRGQSTMMQTKEVIDRGTILVKDYVEESMACNLSSSGKALTGEVSKHQSFTLESKGLEIAKKEILELKEFVEELQRKLKIAEEKDEYISWVINEEEVELTEEVVGKGGYGEVKVAIFRGTRVAAKVLHHVILSVYNQQQFTREMTIAAKIRHPNLLLFIGATREREAVILTELMPTSLQKELEKRDMQLKEIISIAQDVAYALLYLHEWRPSPIIHRDISSANVLLESLANGWRAKVSDFGSANFMNAINTVAPGNPAYAAPEARYPNQHSPKMDTFSYGVLLKEMSNRRLPDSNSMEREAQIKQIQWTPMASLVRWCTSEKPADRPSMRGVIEKLAVASKEVMVN